LSTILFLTGTGTGSGTLKNPKFSRVPGIGSGWNTKFEKKRVLEPVPGNPKFVKRAPESVHGNPKFCKGFRLGTGTGSGILKNPRLCRVLLGTGSDGTLNL
jgi:hypothetical protein